MTGGGRLSRTFSGVRTNPGPRILRAPPRPNEPEPRPSEQTRKALRLAQALRAEEPKATANPNEPSGSPQRSRRAGGRTNPGSASTQRIGAGRPGRGESERTRNLQNPLVLSCVLRKRTRHRGRGADGNRAGQDDRALSGRHAIRAACCSTWSAAARCTWWRPTVRMMTKGSW
jgi:hypothetical protein